MREGGNWLAFAGCLSLGAALSHVAAIVGGAEWYRMMGASERMARAAERGEPFPAIATPAIALILAGWAAYAASGAGLIVRLPFLRPVLIAITLVYLARGMVLFWPDLLRRQDLTPGFLKWSSLIVLMIGAFTLSGYGRRGRRSLRTAVARLGRIARRGALLMLIPLLSGCVAFAALPVLAGGAMFAGGNVKIRAATRNPGAPKLARRKLPERAGLERTRGEPANGVDLAALTALPPPTTTAPDPWAQFVNYALEQVPAEAEQSPGRSALLVSGASLEFPRLRPCTARDRAVIVDLDRADGSDAAPPPPGLARQLERLRAAGIVVVWITQRPSSEVADVAGSLRNSGLDPAGTDPLLLLRTSGDRKQALREAAALDVCPIAIAGDRKGDFDELFDYLRDPQAAAGLDSLFGSGWFIVPPPL